MLNCYRKNRHHLTQVVCTLMLLSALLLAGCGGDGGSTTETTQPDTSGTVTTGGILEGQVADGYLVDALVFLDLNGNKALDPGEPNTLSGNGGKFRLETKAGMEALHSVVVQVHAGETLDEDDQALVRHGYTLETPTGQHKFISPLTTMVKQELDKNAAFDLQDAENMVRGRLGLNDRIQLWHDYVAAETDNPEDRSWRTTHDLARVIAHVNGRLLAALKANLGGELMAADQTSATSIISDQIMVHAGMIDALVGQHSPLSADSLEQIVEQVLSQIDTTSLTRERLDHYRALLASKPQTWDAVPPSILAQQPAAGVVVPVATKIVLQFSEAIDPASLNQESVALLGGGQLFAGQINYDPETLRVEFVPSSPLYALTRYTVKVSAEIKDLQGNRLGTTKGWDFSTLFAHSPPTLPVL